MNQELQSFLETNLNSLLKIDLLSFFQRNPYVVGQVEDIATCQGVSKIKPEEVAPNLSLQHYNGMLSETPARVWAQAEDKRGWLSSSGGRWEDGWETENW